MYSISDYSVNYFLRNASHIYACIHPNPNFMIWPKRPPLAFSVAETSVAEMSGPKRPRPKCPWPKCPTFVHFMYQVSSISKLFILISFRTDNFGGKIGYLSFNLFFKSSLQPMLAI